MRIGRCLLLVALLLSPRALAPGLLAQAPVASPIAEDQAADSTPQVDPAGLILTQLWSADAGQAGADYGAAVATAGDVNGDGYTDILVGAPLFDGDHTDEGRACVYYGSASGPGAAPGWTALGGRDGAHLGAAVATAGDVNADGYADVVVGAPGYGDGQADEGAFSVYLGSASGLGPTPARVVTSNQAGALLGCAVATAGDVNGDGYDDVIAGASGLNSEAGAAYVFYGSAGGLSSEAAWSKTPSQAGASYGCAVGTAGDVDGDGYADIVVGACWFDSAYTDEGAAYVYHGSDSGPGSAAAWTSTGGQADAAYGAAVDTAGDVNGDGYSDVIVGARFFDDGQVDEGRVSIYHGSASGLRTSASAAGQNNWGYSQLGYSAGPAGDVNGDGYADVIAGAPYYTNGTGQSNEGAAYVFEGSTSGVRTAGAWTQQLNRAEYRYGQSVGAAGDVNGDGYADIIVGAPGVGRAYVLAGGPATPAGAPVWSDEGDAANFGYGRCVATAGDVNGDGYADVIVGSSYLANVDYAGGGDVSDGRVDVYYGAATGIPANPSWTKTAGQAATCFGISVASAGDVNGDGYGDVIVGAFLYDHGSLNEGAAFVYLGSAAGLASTPAWSAYGGRALAYFGRAVAGAGDINGDGYGDLIVGAYGYSRGQTDEGAAFVYLGSATGPGVSPVWSVESNKASAWYGYSVACAGDVNRDGHSDIIVGARRYTNTYTAEGAAFVYYGSDAGPSVTPNWTVFGGFDVGYCTCPESNCGVYTHCVGEFGCSVASAGDVNGDGYSDVIIGARKSGQQHTFAGRAYVFSGSVTGLGSTPSWFYEAQYDNNSIKSELGYCVATAGDVNGDGYSDVIAGANHYRAGDPYVATDEGRAYLFLGAPAGLSASPVWFVTGDIQYACLGQSVASAGDVNGDGYADMLVSAPTYANGQQHEGRAYLFLGSGGAGLPVRARAVRIDHTTPIQPLGYADASTSVPLRLTARMPLGREVARVEWQMALSGVQLGAPGTLTGQSDGWTLVRLGGALIVQPASGLQPSSAYHWRVRLRYRPGNRLGLVAGRWLYNPLSGAQETDFNTRARVLSMQNVELALGWNLVSFSGQPVRSGLPITRVADILQSIDGKYDLVQCYDASDPGDPWKAYDPSAPEASALRELAPGQAFWIHTTQPTTWSLRREELYAGLIPLRDGWNLIGWPLDAAQPLPEALQRIAGSYAIVWAYHAQPPPPTWLQYDPSADPWANGLTEMSPNWGYWIRATEEQDLYVTAD